RRVVVTAGGARGASRSARLSANRLHAQLAGPGMDFLATVIPAAVRGLPPDLHQEYITAVMAALRPVFMAAAVISALGFVLTFLLREHPLREGAPAEGVGESFAMPRDATSLEELERIIALLVGARIAGASMPTSPGGRRSNCPRPNSGCWRGWAS